MHRSRVWSGALVAALVGSSAARAEPRHTVLTSRVSLRTEVAPGGVIHVTPDRLVVAFRHSLRDGVGKPHVFVLDRATLKSTVEYEQGDPNFMAAYERTAFFGSAEKGQGSSFRLVDLDRGNHVESFVYAEHGPAGLFTQRNGAIQRVDPRDGTATWEAKLKGVGVVSDFAVGRQSVWIQTDKRVFVQLSVSDGKELGRYEVPAAEADQAIDLAMTLLTVGDKEALVVSLGNVPMGKEDRGTVFRLVGDGRPKDLGIKGARAGLATVRRLGDVRTLAFERKGKVFAAARGREDESVAGDPDSYFSIDVRRWRLGARTPIAAEGPSTSDQGFTVVGREVWDVGEGKKVQAATSADGRWVELTDRHAVEWDAQARALKLLPLPSGEPKVVRLEGAEEVQCAATRDGAVLAVLARRADGKSALSTIDAAGTLRPVREHGGAARLAAIAPTVVDGQLWILVAEAEGVAARMNLHAVDVAP